MGSGSTDNLTFSAEAREAAEVALAEFDELACCQLDKIDDKWDRLRCLFAQWHVDETTNAAAAYDYADRLMVAMVVSRLLEPKEPDGG